MGQFLDDAHDDVDAKFECYMELRIDPEAAPEEVERARLNWREAERALASLVRDPLFNR